MMGDSGVQKTALFQKVCVETTGPRSRGPPLFLIAGFPEEPWFYEGFYTTKHDKTRSTIFNMVLDFQGFSWEELVSMFPCSGNSE